MVHQFIICNDCCLSLTLNIEPEGASFPLGRGEEVSVIDEYSAKPVTIKLSTSDAGNPILSIWPGDGNVRIEKCGTDVLDLLQKGAGV